MKRLMKHFDFEQILTDACTVASDRLLVHMFLLHNPSFLEKPYASEFFKGLKVSLDLEPLQSLGTLRFPSDWDDPGEKELFLYLLLVSPFPFSLEKNGNEIWILLPAEEGWGMNGFAPMHTLPISEVKRMLPRYFMRTLRAYYLEITDLEPAANLLEEVTASLSETECVKVQP